MIVVSTKTKLIFELKLSEDVKLFSTMTGWKKFRIPICRKKRRKNPWEVLEKVFEIQTQIISLYLYFALKLHSIREGPSAISSLRSAAWNLGAVQDYIDFFEWEKMRPGPGLNSWSSEPKPLKPQQPLELSPQVLIGEIVARCFNRKCFILWRHRLTGLYPCSKSPNK